MQDSGDVTVNSQSTQKRRKMTNIKVKDVSSCINNLQSLTTSINNIQPTEDEFNIFGQSVAIQLKKLPLAQAIAAQNEIQTLLTRYRLSNISNTRIISPICNSALSTPSYENESYENLSTPSTCNVYEDVEKGDVISHAIMSSLENNYNN